MKKYVAIGLSKEDWDEPVIEIIDAIDEDDAFNKFAIECGFTEEEVYEGKIMGGAVTGERTFKEILEYQGLAHVIKEIK